MDICESGDGVSDYLELHDERERAGGGVKKARHRVRIGYHLMQMGQKAVLNDQIGFEVVQLCYAECCGLPHVGILIPQAFLQRIAKVIDNLLGSETAHGPDGEGTNEGVWIIGVLDEGVDGEDDEFGLGLCIVH